MKIRATPTELAGSVIADGLNVLGGLRRVALERWTTDHLGAEAWAAVQLVDGVERYRRWFTTPGPAAAAAVRMFTVASYGDPPITAAQIASARPVRPRGTWIADVIVPPARTPKETAS